jgi:hypothetical protein
VKVGSFDRPSLKSEARRFSENSVRLPSCESPLKLRVPPCFLIGYLETNCQHGNEIHSAIVKSGTMHIFGLNKLIHPLPLQLAYLHTCIGRQYMRVYILYNNTCHREKKDFA